METIKDSMDPVTSLALLSKLDDYFHLVIVLDCHVVYG